MISRCQWPGAGATPPENRSYLAGLEARTPYPAQSLTVLETRASGATSRSIVRDRQRLDTVQRAISARAAKSTLVCLHNRLDGAAARLNEPPAQASTGEGPKTSCCTKEAAEGRVQSEKIQNQATLDSVLSSDTDPHGQSIKRSKKTVSSPTGTGIEVGRGWRGCHGRF